MTNKIKVAVLGAGAWSVATHIPALLDNPDVELVVVTSQDSDKAKEIAGVFGFKNWTTDWKKALAEFPLDLAIISTPPALHEEMVLSALDKQIHVMCEKPFAMNYESAKRMMDRATAAGRTITIGYGWPHTPIFQRVKTLLEQKLIGNLEQVNLRITANIRDLLLGTSTLDWSDKNILSEVKTYSDPKIAIGGAIATTLSHSFGLLFHYIEEDIESVFGMRYPKKIDIEFHDEIVARTHSGTLIGISCSSTSKKSMAVTWAISFIGNKGEIHLNTESKKIQWINEEEEMHVEQFDEIGATYTAKEPVNIALQLARGNSVAPGSDVLLAVKSTKLTDAIIKSFNDETLVRLDA